MHGRGAGRSPENLGGGKLLSLGEILHSKNASHCVGKLIMQCIHFCKGYMRNIKDWRAFTPDHGLRHRKSQLRVCHQHHDTRDRR